MKQKIQNYLYTIKNPLLVLFLSFFVQSGFTQTDTLSIDDIYNMPLEELLQLKITSATRHEETAIDIPATIYLIGEEEIEKYGMFDLKQVLYHTPGIEYAYPHSWLQGGQRGITGNWSKSKLLINGIDINLLYTNEAFIGNQFALDNIEQIEIIQGPGSVIYGADAFSGVINIVTKAHPAKGIHARIRNTSGIGQDGMQYNRANALVTGANDKLSFSLSSGITQMEDVDFSDFVKTSDFSHINRDLRAYFIENGGESYIDNNKAHDLHLNLNLKLNNKNTLETDILHLYDQDGGGQEYAELSFERFQSIRQQEFISVKYNHEFNKTNSVHIRTQHRYDKELNDWILQDTVAGGGISPTYSWDVDGSYSQQYEFFWNINSDNDNNYTILGSGYRQDNLATIYYEEATFEHLNKFLNPVNYFVFFQTQQYFLQRKLYATMGMRKDFHSIYEAPSTIRCGLTYKPNKSVWFKYFYNEAFRAPTLFDLEINNKLMPESNNTHEVSISVQPINKLFLQTATYYSRTYDLIVTVQDASSANEEDIFISKNAEEQDFYGNESIIKYLGNTFSAEYWINYSHSDNMLKLSPWKSGLKLSYNFRNENNNNTRTNILKRHSISLLVHYTSPIETDYLNTLYETQTTKIDPATTTDIIWHSSNIILWRSLQADFTLSVQNLFNSDNYYPNMRGNNPLSFKEQSRSFWIQLNIKI